MFEFPRLTPSEHHLISTFVEPLCRDAIATPSRGLCSLPFKTTDDLGYEGFLSISGLVLTVEKIFQGRKRVLSLALPGMLVAPHVFRPWEHHRTIVRWPTQLWAIGSGTFLPIPKGTLQSLKRNGAEDLLSVFTKHSQFYQQQAEVLGDIPYLPSVESRLQRALVFWAATIGKPPVRVDDGNWVMLGLIPRDALVWLTGYTAARVSSGLSTLKEHGILRKTGTHWLIRSSALVSSLPIDFPHSPPKNSHDPIFH